MFDRRTDAGAFSSTVESLLFVRCKFPSASFQLRQAESTPLSRRSMNSISKSSSQTALCLSLPFAVRRLYLLRLVGLRLCFLLL